MVGDQSADMDRECSGQPSLGIHPTFIKSWLSDANAQKGIELGIAVRTVQVEGFALY